MIMTTIVGNPPNLKCIPFYCVDYANYNKLIRDISKSEEIQLQELYSRAI